MKALLVLTLFAASPVLAECPVAADLADGVRVTESDGTVNLFTAIGDGAVVNDGTSPDGYTYRNILAQGTHLVELGDTSNGAYIPDTRRVVNYPFARVDMPIPSAAASFDFATTITTGTGEYAETQTQKWGTLSSLTIGACTYDMIPAKVVYTNADYVVLEGLYYLPALELALLHSYQIQGEPASNYVASKIETVQ